MRSLAAICGSLAGVAGLTHAVGELLQGSRSPGGIVFESWTHGPIAANLGGEPALTLIPNLRLTGILTIVASLAVIAWSLWFLDRRQAGTVLVVLSAAMLMVGGGFGPPILGMLAGLVAGAAHAMAVHIPHQPLAGRSPHGGRGVRPLAADALARHRAG